MKSYAIHALTVLIAATGIASAAAAEPVNLKISSFAPPRSHNVSFVFKPWIPKVLKDSCGDLKMSTYWGGALGRNPAKHLKLTMDGVADISFIAPSYTRGRFPDVTIFSLPYMINSSTEGSLAYWRLFDKKLLRGFKGIKVLALYTTSISMVNTMKPVKDIADLKGMKLLATGQARVKAIQMIGGVPVGIRVTKAAESLSRGVIQGALLDYTAIRSFKVQDVAFNHFNLNVGSTSLAVVMNEAKYNSLSACARAAIDKHSGEALSAAAGIGFDKIGLGNMKKLQADPKHSVVVPSAGQVTRYKKVFQPLHDAWRAKSAHDAKVYDTTVSLLKDIRAAK